MNLLLLRRLCLLLALLACVQAAGAQTSRIKRAQRTMADLNYSDAIQQFNQILETSDDANAKIALAEAYRKINDPINAEYWFGQIVRLPESSPVHKLYYGQALQQNGKCDQAKEWFAIFMNEQPDDLRGQYLGRACDYEQELLTRSAGVYAVSHLEFNSALDDFGAAVYEDGILFASDRSQGVAVKRDHAWTGNPFLELLYVKTMRTDQADPQTTVYGTPDKFDKTFNSKYHEAAVTVAEDGTQMFFTRNNYKDGKLGRSDDGIVKLKVFYADKKGKEWGELQSLPFNSDEYSVLHPAISPSGRRLYFASDMPGGFGGMDIYYSEKENGRWNPPVNLGPNVNNEGHQAFPSVAPDGHIYFASDGHVGLGGYDLYYTTEKAAFEFTLPENLGAPLNSTADDHSILLLEDGGFGYFSSNRTGGAGKDDIYSFVRTGIPVEVLVIDADTRLPIEGATVLNGCTSGSSVTDVNGIAAMGMSDEDKCKFTASAEAYEEATTEGTTLNFKGSKLIVELPLKPLKEYSVEGFVFDESSGAPIGGALVTLTSPLDPKGVTSLTNTDGRYTFDIVKGMCYSVRASMQDFLSARADNLCATDTARTSVFDVDLFLQPTIYGGPKDSDLAGTPIRPDNDPDARLYQEGGTGLYVDAKTGKPADGVINGRTFKNGSVVNAGGKFDRGLSDIKAGDAIPYLLHIYYDFNMATIRAEAREDLDGLYAMLTENPEVIIEIGSHTDARGSDDYNMRLSQRRAEAVVRYMEQRGVHRDRLVPRGYGETVPVNNCNNNVPCSEREHQFNRRTEFRVLGCSTCEDTGKRSQPREDVEVSRCRNCPF